MMDERLIERLPLPNSKTAKQESRRGWFVIRRHGARDSRLPHTFIWPFVSFKSNSQSIQNRDMHFEISSLLHHFAYENNREIAKL